MPKKVYAEGQTSKEFKGKTKGRAKYGLKTHCQ